MGGMRFFAALRMTRNQVDSLPWRSAARNDRRTRLLVAQTFLLALSSSKGLRGRARMRASKNACPTNDMGVLTGVGGGAYDWG